MRSLRDMPIKQKLMVIIMSVTTSALLFSGLALVISDSFLFRQLIRRDISTLAQIVADNSTAALAFDDRRTASDILASLRTRPHLAAACIYRPDSTLFAMYSRPGGDAPCPAAGPASELRFTRTELIARQPITLDTHVIGTLVLVYDLDELSERVRMYGQVVLLILLGSGLFAFLLSSWLRTIVSRPVTHLVDAARSVSATHDYSIRAQQLSRDELGRLAEDFNEMLARIQAQDDELRKALLAHETALRETRRIRDSLRTTLASIGDAVISTDADGRVVFVNHVAQSLLGLTEAESLGKHLDEIFRIVNEFTRAPVESPVAKVLREGSIVGLANHTVLLSRNGAEIPIDDSGAPIRDESGAVQGTVLVFRDVTPRRRADETSRLLASIVESSNDAVFSKNLDAVVTSWNRGAERMFGFSAEEIVGRPIAAIVPDELLYEIPRIMEQIRRGERIEHYETVRRTRAGDTLNVSIAVSPLHDPLGRITGASVISRDITERVRAAERLAELNAELRKSNETLILTNQDLERFAFIASHDLQEPLRMITAYSQLLIKSFSGQLDNDASMFVSYIVDGTKRMRDLLADLLEYTAIRGPQDEFPQIVDLNLVMEHVRQNLKPAIDETQAVVTSDSLPSLHAHPAHFQPLFQNLVSNAIKYRGECPPRIHVSAEKVDGQLRFSVSDNGVGIEPEYHDLIFGLFKRLHGKKIPGTGVGLAICQRIVERYGGRIWVESQAGQGATFLFSLPDISVDSQQGKQNE